MIRQEMTNEAINYLLALYVFWWGIMVRQGKMPRTDRNSHRSVTKSLPTFHQERQGRTTGFKAD